jgi:alkylation response protein AidB-like acyl-CoA dehydrogenase
VTPFIVIAVIVLVVIGVAAYVIRQRNREANIARADHLRTQAAAQAQSTLPPTQDRAAEAEARAEEARAAAQRADAEAEEARVAAAQAEATHESQVRAADRLDPRVDHKADDYAPQVGGTVDQQPTPPSEVNVEPPAEPAPAETSAQTTADGAPSLPQRTRGAQEMPGKPIEQTDSGGGWFTKGSHPGQS